MLLTSSCRKSWACTTVLVACLGVLGYACSATSTAEVKPPFQQQFRGHANSPWLDVEGGQYLVDAKQDTKGCSVPISLVRSGEALVVKLGASSPPGLGQGPYVPSGPSDWYGVSTLLGPDRYRFEGSGDDGCSWTVRLIPSTNLSPVATWSVRANSRPRGA